MFGNLLAIVFGGVRGGLSCFENWFVAMLRMGGVRGEFNGASILGNVSFGVRRKRMISIVNSSKDNGAALLHYVAKLRSTSRKEVSMNKEMAFSDRHGRGLSERRGHRGRLYAKLIFRSFGLFPRCAILHGMALTGRLLMGRRYGGGGLSHRSGGGGLTTVDARTVGVVRDMNLESGARGCPYRLSNNRRRQITVTHTLVLSPRLLYFSRPADTLSPRVANRILGIVEGLTRSNGAVLVIARRVKFTHRISGGIVCVRRNIVTRRKAPRRVFSGPGDSHLGSFLGSALEVWSLGLATSTGGHKTSKCGGAAHYTNNFLFTIPTLGQSILLFLLMVFGRIFGFLTNFVGLLCYKRVRCSRVIKHKMIRYTSLGR